MRERINFISMTALLLIVSFSVAVSAQVPRLINYQGRLTDKDGQALDGSYQLTFKIYDVETAGASLWEEVHTTVIIDGLFSVLLGDNQDLMLPFDKPYFLEIQVGGETMSPRQQITSVGYAVKSESAKEADGLPEGVILMCKGSCPAGYKKVSELDGKFLVGGSSYNSNAGGKNTHDHEVGSYKSANHSHKLAITQPGWSITHTYESELPWVMGVIEGPGNTLVIGAGSQYRYGMNTKLKTYTETTGGDVIEGTSASADSRPEFATIVLCEKE